MIRATLAVLWILGMSLLYIGNWNPVVLQHPLSLFFRQFVCLSGDIPAALQKLFTHGLTELFFLVLLCLTAYGIGNKLLGLIRLKLHGMFLVLLSFAGGLTAIAYYTLLLGIVGGYNFLGLVISWTVMLCFAPIGGLQFYRQIRSKRGKINWLTVASLLFLSIIGVFLFSKALLPAVHYDAITYHLGVPKYFLLEGGISYIPYDSCASFPFFAEMLYAFCFMLSGQKAAQFSSVLFFLLTAVTIYGLSKHFIKTVPPWLPMLFFLITPAFMVSALNYGNDLHLVYYLMICLYVFLAWEKHRDLTMGALFGIFSGVCMSIKYSALTWLPLLCLLGTVYIAIKSQGAFFRHWLQNLFICFLPALVLFSPWLIQNYIYTGNPLYPVFYPLLGGTDMSMEMYQNIKKMVSVSDLKTALRGLWETPVELLFFRAQQHEMINGLQHQGLLRNIGPVILFFLPLLFLLKQIPLAVKTIIVTGLTIYIVWCFTFVETRFLYPSIVMFIITAAYALHETVRRSSTILKYLIIGTTFLILIFTCIMGFQQANLVTQTCGYDFMNESDDQFLRRHMLNNMKAILFSYPVYQYVNDRLSPDAIVLIIGDAQHLYIDRRHRYTYLSATTPYDVFKETPGDYENIVRSLKSDGITHIIYNPLEMKRLINSGALSDSEIDQQNISDFLSSPRVRQLYTFHLLVDNDKHDTDVKGISLYELL